MSAERDKMPDKFKERYDFTCSECGHEMQAEPSIAMTDFGLNSGHGKCSKCGTFLRLKIAANGEYMESESYDKFNERTRAAWNKGD